MHSVKVARVRAGMTLAELAEKSGLRPTTISQIKRGIRAPHATTIYKLALALHVDPANLMSEEKVAV